MNKTLIAIAVSLSLFGGAMPAFADTTTVQANMIGQLHKGSQGDAVKLLQAILAADPTIYPEGIVSGSFGSLTAKAVMRFQKKHGLEAVGNVGPKTLMKLNDDLASSTTLGLEDRGGKKQPCAIVPPGHLIAPGWLKRNGGVAPIVPTCQTLPKGIWDHINGSTTPDRGDHHGTTTPDVTAPLIFSVAASNVASTSASVHWLTSEIATSKVFFGSSTPLNLTTARNASSTSLVGTHTLSLTGLTASTTYYYVVQSADASGNSATSSQSSFVTLSL